MGCIDKKGRRRGKGEGGREEGGASCSPDTKFVTKRCL